MKRIILVIFILHSFSIGLFAQVYPDIEPEGLIFSSALSYGNVFDSDYKFYTINIFEYSIFSLPPWPSLSKYIVHVGLLTQFSFDINIFDH